MNNLPQSLVSMSKPPSAGENIKLHIDKAALEIVACECGVTQISHLEAKFRVKRWRKHGIALYGEFDIKLEQECVASLEPITSSLKNTIERQFLPLSDSDYKKPEIIDGEMILDPEVDDIPDIIEGDEINLWEVLIEELILVIDPFPRAEDYQSKTVYEVAQSDQETNEPTHKPFSDLKALISEKKTNK